MRAQAAIEYLTTYGWAVVVLIIMLGALSYFGVINPRSWAPDRCEMGAEFTCIDHQFYVDTSGPTDNVTLTIYFTNNLQERISISSLTCKFESTAAQTNAVSLTVGSQDEGEISCGTTDSSVLSARGKIKATYTLVYNKRDKPFEHEIDGTAFSTLVR